MPRVAIAALVVSMLTAVWAGMMLTPIGQVVYITLFIVSEFYGGVLTLVTLTLTVMAGVLATDRTVLMIKNRVMLQSTHRALGIVAVGALGLHVLTKVGAGKASVLDSVVPFVSGAGVWIGLGTVAAFGMVSVLWTGIIRLRFAGRGKPWMWRTMHSTAYVSWPVALLHGLNAGRTPATWVSLSYLLCVLLVVGALLVRLSTSLGRKRRESVAKPATAAVAAAAEETASDRGRAGAWVPGRRPVANLRVSRTVAVETGDGPGDVLDSWAPAAGYRNVESPRRRSNRFAVPQVPVPAAEEVPAWRAAESTPSWRSEERPSRRSEERPSWRSDERPAAASSTLLSDDVPEEPWTSPRRWSSPPPSVPEPADNYWEAPATSRRRYAEAATGTSRPVSGPRHSRDDDEEAAAYPPPLPEDDTPTLVDLASRRARKEAERSSSSSSRRRRRAEADVVDSAYFAQLRGEAQ
ncbi:hypothetical protein [Plantactinospora sp. GCM10030261]|uniref:hypothetical protein n=1 Tax=Plantactinospora sp. GCM10030261 TaxID=3273420 RepID=UPI00360AB2FD